MIPPRNELAPQTLAEQKRDFTAEGAPAPDKQAPSSTPRQACADAATQPPAKLHRETLTLKRASRARYP